MYAARAPWHSGCHCRYLRGPLSESELVVVRSAAAMIIAYIGWLAGWLVVSTIGG